jgi:ADP-ribose pyrophosphatase YjhB (NUDIX family)
MRNISRHPILVTAICFSKGALFTIPRAEEPYEGFPTLPEGPLRKAELPEACVSRVLREASGLEAMQVQFLGLHTSLERIPNTRVFILSYLVRNWIGEIPLENCRWISDWRNERMAFEEQQCMLIEADSVLKTAMMNRALFAVR